MAFSEQVKLTVKRKAHFMCCLCKSIDVEIHHIIPQEQSGPDTEHNAAPLCPSCHETYGGNPKKRKLIRESKKLWFEICEKRYSSSETGLNEILKLLKTINTNTKPKTLSEIISTSLSDSLLTTNENKGTPLSLGEILDILNKNKEPKTEIQIINFKTTYLLLFETKGNLKSTKDREYNTLKNEFKYIFGLAFQKKIVLYLNKYLKINWATKSGVAELQIEKLGSACFFLMFCLLHHYDLMLKEFFINTNINQKGQFTFSLRQGMSREKLIKIYNEYNSFKF